MNNITEITINMKKVAPILASSSITQRNHALSIIAQNLQTHSDKIFSANEQDLHIAIENNITPAVLKRLKFDTHKLKDVIAGLTQLQTLSDPLQHTSLARELDQSLTLYRVACPIGVIGVIFEARPDALVQISSLCIKSGNCAILKGGKETSNTNKILFQLIHESIIQAGLPSDCLFQAEQHNEIDELLACHEYVDLLIPRGSNSFVQYIMNHTKIPVMGHADGICHMFIDEEFNPEKAIPIIIDSKIQYCAACNAVETLLIHRKALAKLLPNLILAFSEQKIHIRCTKDFIDSSNHLKVTIPKDMYQIISDDDFKNEYLDSIIAIKIVDSTEEAITHINHYGSHHTDCIITENASTAKQFMQMVDSAGVYQNCSTRFADGFRYGFGAEVGISTGKIHARGPVGLEGLVTYKYQLFGNGQIVGDYASGKSEFHFKDL